MVVNSVLTGLSPSYGPRSGDPSKTAKPAAPGKDVPKSAFAAEVDAARDASAPDTNAPDAGQTQSTLERARRQAEAAAESPRGEAAGSPGERNAPGIALYARISQYDNGGPSSSTLLKSWNEIMRSGQDAEGAAAAFAKTLSQNETLGLESGILDLTA